LKITGVSASVKGPLKEKTPKVQASKKRGREAEQASNLNLNRKYAMEQIAPKIGLQT
jgi:hypothetical protein